MENEDLEQFRLEDHLPFLDPVIVKWFNQNYTEITDPQKRAIPLIHARKNVLVSSPTGTGKTLTGFLSVINELIILARNGQLEDKIYCVYVSPLKALANDIDRNLKKPLDGIYEILVREGESLKKITVGVRSGDTPQNERQKMLRKPPNILITTPESLSLALSAPKFREKFTTARWVILDEIHEISSTKRGSLLSVNLERLQTLCGGLIRIGLSATQAPLDVIASYLCGYENGKPRPYEIVDVDTKKFLDLRTVTPVSNLTQYSSEVANNMMYDVLAKYIEEHQTTLVFTNTRSSTEHVAIRLKARGVESIEAHHSSLGKETRHEVERKLKAGELRCVITSTSLELGIDIGYIDLVVQIGSPKSVSKGLQRIGRSGHGIHDLSMGRFLVFDLDDLMECAVLTRAAYDRNIDRVKVPMNPLDVLSQVLVGMSLEKAWDVEEAYDVLKSSYTFHELPREDFVSTIEYLAGDMEAGGIYPKIWYDKAEQRFGKKKSTRMIYFMNIGTIPDESDFQVVNERGKHLGQLSEKFAERLKSGDVFVLGAKTYLYLRSSRNRILVKDAVGLRPTVPSWSGEMLPRSYDLGVLIGMFRSELSRRVTAGSNPRQWLMDEYMLDASGAESLISYVKNQAIFNIPTESHLYVEGYRDEAKNYNIIFHVPLGRRVNDALSRAYAQAISNQYNQNLRITVTDDGFMLTSPVKISIRESIGLITPENFEETVRRSIWNTEVFKQRFRHCAARALMVLRRYKGYDISVARQQLRSDKVLKYLDTVRNFPVLKETFREIMEEMMDVPAALRYVGEVITAGDMTVREYSTDPSPFSHGIILAGVSDIVLMEDRAKLFRQLQSKILEKVYGSETFRFLISDPKTVELHFAAKVPRIRDKESYVDFLKHFLYVDPFKSKFNSPFPYADVPVADITQDFIDRDELVSVFVRGTQWTHISMYDLCRTLFSSGKDPLDSDIPIMEHCTGKTFNEIRNDSGLEENDVRNSLIRLESAYLIRKKMRSGISTYVRNEIEEKPVKDAEKEAVLRILGSFGPLTVDEILIKAPISQDVITSVLDGESANGTVIHDFITPVYSKQYMLKEDLDALLTSSERDILAERNISMTSTVSTVDEYFDRFGFAFDPWSLISRGVHASESILQEMADSGKIYRCRAIRRKDSFVSGWLLEALYSIRHEELTREGQQVLDAIISGFGTESEICTKTGLEHRIVRQILSLLEYHLLAKRVENRYIPFLSGPPKVPADDAVRMLFEKFGPATRREISSYFWIDLKTVPGDIKNLYHRGEVYYGSTPATGRKDPVILSLSDPVGIYLEHNYSRISSVNGVLISEGKELADFSMNVRSNVCWIDDVEGKLPDPGILEAAMKFMVDSGYVRASVANFATQSAMKEISVGSIRTLPVTEDELFERSIAHYLAPRSIHNHQPFVLIKNFRLGFRTESEFSRTGLSERSLDTYLRSRLIFNFSGPFANVSIGSLDTISLFRDVREKEISEIEKSILRFIEESGYVSEQEIRSSVRGSGIGLRGYLKDIFGMGLIARDHSRKYTYVPPGNGRMESLTTLIKFMADTFGFCDKERIKGAFPEVPEDYISDAINALVSRGDVEETMSPLARSIVYLSPVKPKKASGSSIIFPRESIMLYHREYLKQKFGSSNVFLLVNDGKVVCAFKARKKGHALNVTWINGDRSNRDVIRRGLNTMGYAVAFS